MSFMAGIVCFAFHSNALDKDTARKALELGGKTGTTDEEFANNNLKTLRLKFHTDRVDYLDDSEFARLAKLLIVLQKDLNDNTKAVLPNNFAGLGEVGLSEALKNIKNGNKASLITILDDVFKLLGQAKDAILPSSISVPQYEPEPKKSVLEQLDAIKNKLNGLKVDFENIEQPTEAFQKKLLGSDVQTGQYSDYSAYRKLFVRASALDALKDGEIENSLPESDRQKYKQLIAEAQVLAQQALLGIVKNLLNFYKQGIYKDGYSDAKYYAKEITDDLPEIFDKKYADELQKVIDGYKDIVFSPVLDTPFKQKIGSLLQKNDIVGVFNLDYTSVSKSEGEYADNAVLEYLSSFGKESLVDQKKAVEWLKKLSEIFPKVSGVFKMTERRKAYGIILDYFRKFLAHGYRNSENDATVKQVALALNDNRRYLFDSGKRFTTFYINLDQLRDQLVKVNVSKSLAVENLKQVITLAEEFAKSLSEEELKAQTLSWKDTALRSLQIDKDDFIMLLKYHLQELLRSQSKNLNESAQNAIKGLIADLNTEKNIESLKKILENIQKDEGGSGSQARPQNKEQAEKALLDLARALKSM